MSMRPNPQGKGLVPILESLASSRAHIDVPPKQIDQIASELFTSLFVLNSDFKFKPVVGKTYWLYRRNGRFQLSHLGPDEWSAEIYGQYIGECTLQEDITWTLTLDAAAAEDEDLIAHIETRQREFEQALESAESLEDTLPVFEGRLPFYQRVFAAALANSLSSSMTQSGILQMTYNEARGLLTDQSPDKAKQAER